MFKTISDTSQQPKAASFQNNADDLNVLLVGPNLNQKGGMASVQKLILQTSSSPISVRHLCSHDEGSLMYRNIVAAKALFIFAYTFLFKNIGVVHIHVSERGSIFREGIFLLLAKYLFQTPVILHTHGCEFHVFYDNLPIWAKYIVRFIFQSANHVIVLSQSWKEYYISCCNLDESHVVILPNPVRIPNNIPERAASEIVNFAFLGRIGERKGVFDLIQAFASLPDHQRKKAHLTLAGDGQIDIATDLVKQLNLTKYVSLPGWLSTQQCEQLLKDSNAFILPSYNEGLPVAMLEAMAWGLPIISSPVGGIPEYLEHGSVGYLIEPGDIRSLTTAIQSLIQDESLRKNMGNSAREVVKHLDVNIYYKQLKKLYEYSLSLV